MKTFLKTIAVMLGVVAFTQTGVNFAVKENLINDHKLIVVTNNSEGDFDISGTTGPGI